MKKNQTVQGTFSKIFGKKHASPSASSLYATNPPWIFAQEAPDEGARVLGKRAPGESAAPAWLSTPAAGSRRARGGGEGTRRNLRTDRPGRSCGRGRRRRAGVSGKGLRGEEARKEGTPPGGRGPVRTAAAPRLRPRCLPAPRAGS